MAESSATQTKPGYLSTQASKLSVAYRAYRVTRKGLRLPWILACVVATIITIVLGVSLGWAFRTKPLEDPGVSSVFDGRKIYTSMTLVAVDPIAGTVTIDWSIDDDDCFAQANSLDDVNNDCPPVNIYFDQNLLAQDDDAGGGSTPSNNRPDSAVFQWNATANFDNFANLPTFRTVINLYSNITKLWSSVENYPFDRYSSDMWIFGYVNGTENPVGVSVYYTTGIAVGYKAVLLPPDNITALFNDQGVTNLTLLIYRTALVKAYAVVIIMAMWLINLILMAIMIKAIFFRYKVDATALVVPVATLFAFTQLRGTMPGAPSSFGTIIDFVGTLPTLAFLVMTTLFCLASFLLKADYPNKPAPRPAARPASSSSDVESGNGNASGNVGPANGKEQVHAGVQELSYQSRPLEL